MKTLYYNIVFHPESEGGYTVVVPALPGCITYGKTLEEAKAMAIDAIQGYIASLRKHDDPIPSDQGRLISAVEVEAKQSTAHAETANSHFQTSHQSSQTARLSAGPYHWKPLYFLPSQNQTTRHCSLSRKRPSERHAPSNTQTCRFGSRRLIIYPTRQSRHKNPKVFERGGCRALSVFLQNTSPGLV